MTTHDKLKTLYFNTTGQHLAIEPDAPWVLCDDGYGNLSVRGVNAPDIAQVNAITEEQVNTYLALVDAEWQVAKHPILKAIENLYIDFLTNMWTPALRTAGLIAEDYSITVDNTSEAENTMYLMQLRAINFDAYNTCASEFSRFKTAITDNGGIMAKIIHHEI